MLIPQFVAPATMTLFTRWSHDLLMNDSSVASCCCCRRLMVGFQLFSPFGFQSRRVASRRAVGRTSDQRSGASPSQSGTNRAVFGCVRTLLLSVCSPSSAPSFSHSLHPSSQSGVPELLLRRDVGDAPLKWTQVRFILLFIIIITSFYFCSSCCPVLLGVSSSC